MGTCSRCFVNLPGSCTLGERELPVPVNAADLWAQSSWPMRHKLDLRIVPAAEGNLPFIFHGAFAKFNLIIYVE